MSESGRDTSIVIDTETNEDGHSVRLSHILSAIARQTRRERILEVLIVADRPPGDAERSAMNGLPARWLERPGLRYYDLKNEGIRESTGGFLVLFDSDAVPEADYLERAFAAFEGSPESVALVTGRTSYMPGAFSRELAIAQLPNQSAEAGDTTHFLAHNVIFRGDVVRGHVFRGGHIRLFPDSDLATRLLAAGYRLRYDPTLRVTHNYADDWRALWDHFRVIGYHDARYYAFLGGRVPGAFRNAVGRYRVLLRRLFGLRKAMGISTARLPLSMAFFALYSAAVGRGYAAGLAHEEEPFAPF